MTRDIAVHLTAAEAHVLLAHLRQPEVIRYRVQEERWAPLADTPPYLGPTLTAIRQRVEAAIAADEPHVHTWTHAPDWETARSGRCYECIPCRAWRCAPLTRDDAPVGAGESVEAFRG